MAEVRGHLVAKGTDATVAGEAVAELERLGYLDDARYAQRFAEDRRALDDWGPERIERRLREVGVDIEQIAVAVGRRDAAEERDAALDLLGRRFATALGDDRERERALRLLVRKGYALELAYDAVRSFERQAG